MTRRMYTIKNHVVASLGEFVGTFLFLFFAFAGTQTANQPSPTQTSADVGPNLTKLLYISLIFGFSLAINVWIFFRISGGLFNPAVTLALCITGVVPVLRSVLIFVAQILGAIAASAVVRGIIPGDEVLFSVQLLTGTSIVQGLFLEMFLTSLLVFTILMLAAEKTKATFVAPVGIGLALFVAELVGVYWTGGALNPARAFGPDVVTGDFNGYHWIYWVGPVLGALLASGFYTLMKFLNYEEVNGDQDKGGDEEQIMEMARQNSRHMMESRHHGEDKAFDGGRQPGSQRSTHSRHSEIQNSHARAPSSSRPTTGHYQSQRQPSPNAPRTSSAYNSRVPAQEMRYDQQRPSRPSNEISMQNRYPRSRDSAEPQTYREDILSKGEKQPSLDPVMGVDGRPYVQDTEAQTEWIKRQQNPPWEQQLHPVSVARDSSRRSGTGRRGF